MSDVQPLAGDTTAPPLDRRIAATLRRAAPVAIAVVPVSMLFGVLAVRADWSLLEVVAISLLGFSGSGQFALLPLAESGAGFFTMLLVTASINSRYLPIAYASAKRLPAAAGKRACLAHMLGDEAYATEHERDSGASLGWIRITIFIAWALAGLLGALLGRVIPTAWLGAEVNLGYPASVVLMYLSAAQLRARLWHNGQRRAPVLAAAGMSAGLALLLIQWLGPVYFWIPSVLLATGILGRAWP
ncbi:AzlC family ABC transporter permease [Halomonas campisalis]|uniref:AzlC family ABC transporter permease n=1 Tax=Billgrantia campisalis TaxID=74661 RepID=A0ABS9PDE6_9GAMM|nr:AzlC family ABC transporter permease [Halomonas campisalis]MCG6659791.1 AzlC family ABC transporter permease [Halomonas campisalis]MDR5864945.1 AzlC family ABC transporter permease [Halomonas campisalis]